MRHKLPLILLLFLLFSVTHIAYGFHFSRFYFVGDSLSDVGNNTTECTGTLPGGPCTNLPRILWPQFLGDKYNISVTYSEIGGTDYAYAGAATNIGGPDIVPVNQQVDILLQDHPEGLDPKGLYTIWAGGDNIVTVVENPPFTDQDFLDAAHQAASDIRNDVIRMHNAGARVIIVGNTPDLSKAPPFLVFPLDLVAQQVKQFGIDPLNREELQEINSLDFDVIQINFASFLDDVIANPAAYGFTDVTTSCSDPSSSCAGQLFVYLIHPTVVGHRILAEYVFSILNAPVFYSKLATVSNNTMASQVNAIEARLMPFIPSQPARKRHFFVIGNASPYQQPPREVGQMRTDFNLYNGTVGYTYFVNPVLELGAAYSHGYTDLNLDADTSHAVINSNLFSIFMSYYPGHYYIYSVFSGGLLDYSDIDRHFMLGPRVVDAMGSTHGNVFGVMANSGWFIVKKSHVRTGPYISTAYGRAGVYGYTESGAPRGVNIQYNDQHENSVISALGWRLDFDREVKNTHFIATFFASGHHQWIGGDRDIHFHLVSLPGSHGFLPVSNLQTNFFTWGFNLTDQLRNGLIFSIGYNINIGSYDLLAQNVNFAVSIPIG